MFQERQNPASNLLSPALGGKWLCAEGNKSRTAEVVIEVSKRVRISSLEICKQFAWVVCCKSIAR